ncbi:hypothetical protein ACF0H5_024052 [Mactra antiquata]
MSERLCLLFLVVLLSGPLQIHGSGSLYDPPNRAVMWKYGFHTGKNYNYMQLNCGGVKQPERGKDNGMTNGTDQESFNCGVCGDGLDGPLEHEQGGRYGSATISRYYPAGIKEIPIKVELLAYEKGFFEFRICPANNNTVTQECLDENLLPIKEGYMAGTPMRFYPKAAGDHRLTIAINPNLTCERCVLQWRYHTANSWGHDPKTKKEGLGLGVQEEFRNCADIRIGGEIPESVRTNPFFGPALQYKMETTADTPVDHVDAFNSQDIASLTIQPEHADHLSPKFRAALFEGPTQTTNMNSQESSWLQRAIHDGHVHLNGNMMDLSESNALMSDSAASMSGQTGQADSHVIERTLSLKELLQPADGHLRLTAGTDIVKVGKGEGKKRKILSGSRSSSTETMATTKQGQTDRAFALDNTLHDGGEVIKFSFEGGHSADIQGGQNNVFNAGASAVAGAASTSASGSISTDSSADATTMGLRRDIATGVIGGSVEGHNLDIGMDVETGTVGLVGPPPTPEVKNTISITAANMINPMNIKVGPQADTVGVVGPAPDPAVKNTIEITAANMVESAPDDFANMKSATRSAFAFAGQGDSSSSDTSPSLGMRLSTTAMRKALNLFDVEGGSPNQGGDIIYDAVTTAMNAASTQPNAQPKGKQRIFQLVVNKPLTVAESMQPDVDISAGSVTDTVRVPTDTQSTSGTTSTTSSSSETSSIASTSSATTSGASTHPLSDSFKQMMDRAVSNNVIGDIDSLRAELIKSSLLHGGGASPIFAPVLGQEHAEMRTEKVYPSNTSTETNVGQGTTTPTIFDGFNNEFIQTNINAIVHEANQLLQSTGDVSANVLDHSSSKSASFVVNDKVQDGPSVPAENDVSSVKQDILPIDTPVDTGASSNTQIDTTASLSVDAQGTNEFMEAQQTGSAFFESMVGGVGGDKVAMFLPGSIPETSHSGVNLEDTKMVDTNKQLGGLTIDLSQGKANNIVPANAQTMAGKKHFKILKKTETTTTSVKKSEPVRADKAANVDFVNEVIHVVNKPAPSVEIRVNNRAIQGQSNERRRQRQNAARPEGDSASIVRQLNSLKIGDITTDTVVREEPRRRVEGGRVRGETRPSRRPETARGMSSRRGGFRPGGSDRSRSMAIMRGERTERRGPVRSDRRRRPSAGDAIAARRREEMALALERRREFDARRRSRGDRFRGESRAGTEARMTREDRRIDLRVREPDRPFGRRAGDRLISDMRDGSFSRPGGARDGERRDGLRFVGRTVERPQTRRSRERTTMAERGRPMDEMGDHRMGDRRPSAPSGERRTGGSRDPKYFVDMSSGMAGANNTKVVIDRGIADRRVSVGSSDGQSGPDTPAVMPRDAVAAFDAQPSSDSRREPTIVTVVSRSDRGSSGDTRLVMRGDLSGGTGSGSADRDMRRDSRMRSDRGDRRGMDSDRRTDFRDGRRESSTRRDSRGRMIRRMPPMRPMPSGGMPGAGFPPGAGMPGAPMFGGGPMFGGPGGGPGGMMGGPAGPMGGFRPRPMGFGPGM